jgi:hypothetical protein
MNRHFPMGSIHLFSVLIASLWSTLASSQEVTPPPLAEAKTIMHAGIRAMGGVKAIEAVKSMHLKGALMAPGGLDEAIIVTMWFSGADQALVRYEFPQAGTTLFGGNGVIAWEKPSPVQVQYRILRPRELELRRREANWFERVTTLGRNAAVFETVGRIEFGGRPCWKIRVVDATGREQFAFFDVETKRPAGFHMAEKGPNGVIDLHVYLRKYKSFGDLTLFTEVVLEQMGVEIPLKFTTIEFDTVDDAVFAVPMQVKMLAAELGIKTQRPIDDPPEQSQETPPPPLESQSP